MYDNINSCIDWLLKRIMKKICIIGAGIIGCAIARELSKYELEISLLEKENDVSMGATKANSGIIHSGYGTAERSLKTILCVKGNSMYDQLDKELHFGFRRCGSLVLGFTQEDKETLDKLLESGKRNGVPGIEIIDKKAVLGLDPGINSDVLFALYAPSAGVASPYEFAIALAENSIANGVSFILNAEIKNIIKDGERYKLETENNKIEADIVINAAGIFSDKIASMAGYNNFSINPRKGQYLIFDKWTGKELKHVLFQVPSKMGKGILVAPTYHYNLMIGPDALDIKERDNYFPDKDALIHIIKTAKISWPSLDLSKIIRTFSGIRAVNSTEDFIVNSPGKGFINAAGIDSPGLTSSPAIALFVKQLIEKQIGKLIPKKEFNPERDAIIKKRENLSSEEVENLIKLPDADNKRLVCRCEQVRQSTITDSLRRGIKIMSTDGVKRRTRAGMGRCQGGFCRKRVKELIAREYGILLESVLETDRPIFNISYLRKEKIV